MDIPLLRLPSPPQGPAEGAGRGRRALPFALVGAAAFGTFFAANIGVLTETERAMLLGLVGALVIAWFLVPWGSMNRAAQAVIPLATIGVIVLMQLLALPSNLDLAALMILPVVWSAAYGTVREAVAVTVAGSGSIAVLQAIETVQGTPVGMTGWTEVVALAGGLILLSALTVTARAHARTDALTGAANRRAWDEILELELERARRYGTPLAVLMLDLDNFKLFNDMHGHAAGDRHLAACASAWMRCLRRSDVLARLGGEEFAVLLVESPGEIGHVAERLLQAVPDGESCSVGVARWDGHEPAAALVARADDALYAAKRGGRGRTVSARPALAPVAA